MRDRDLAVLVVKSDKLPTVIKSTPSIPLTETMPIYVFGFPFGADLTTAGDSPAITVSKGAISSIRKDRFGRVYMIQVDASINPGNSGGPMIAQDGTLIGIAVSKLEGTQIGFSIPVADLRDMLWGRIYDVSFRRADHFEKGVKLDVQGRLIDPLQKLTKVSLHFLPLKKLTKIPTPKDNGDWGLLSSDAVEFEMKISGTQVSTQIVLASAGPGQAEYVVQPSYIRGDGKKTFGPPGLLDVISLRRGTEDDLAAGGGALPAVPKKPKPPLPDDDWLTQPPQAVTDFTGMTEEDGFFYQPPGQVYPVSRTAIAEENPLGTGTTLVVRRLRIPAAEAVPQVVWSPDGNRLYLATGRGAIRVLSLPDMQEKSRLELGGACSHLESSREGLVAVLSTSQHLAVIDPEELTVKKHIRLPGVAAVACSPGSSHAYVLTSLLSDEILVIDLKQGRLVARVNAKEVAGKPEPGQIALTDFNGLKLSPDGKYLFTCCSGALHRLSVEGARLSYDDSTLNLRTHIDAGTAFTHDSKYLLAGVHGGLSLPSHPTLKTGGVYIYPMSNLQQPSLSLETAHAPVGMALDAANRRAYILDPLPRLCFHELAGQKPREYPLDSQFGRPRELFLHPHSRGLVVIMEKAVLWIDLSGK